MGLEKVAHGICFIMLAMEKLPFHHKDPFDRLLLAQAIQEEITLVSSDGIFSEYPVSKLW